MYENITNINLVVIFLVSFVFAFYLKEKLVILAYESFIKLRLTEKEEEYKIKCLNCESKLENQIYKKDKVYFCGNCKTNILIDKNYITIIKYILFFVEVLFLFLIGIYFKDKGLFKKGLITEFIIQYILIIALSVATISDLYDKTIPDEIHFITYILIFLIRVFSKNIKQYVFIGLLPFIMLYLIYLATKGQALGGADVKIYAPIGLALGFRDSMITLIIASTLTIIVYFLKQENKGKEIAFIPYIYVGVIIKIMLIQLLFIQKLFL